MRMLFYKIKTIKMSEIRTTKIDGQEFVTLTDYLRLKEENKRLNTIIENTEIEQKSDREYIEELEEENKKLKKERDELKKEFQQYKEHYNIEKDKQQIFLMTWLRY